MTIEAASSSDAVSERTKVLHGEQNVISTVLQFTSKAKSRIDACVDYTRPSLTIEIEELRKAFLDAKRRGIRLRYVTEITEDNVVYCKELLKMVDELRHIEGIKGNFYISETEYIAPATLHTKGKPASHIVYSNVKEIVEQQRQFVFDSFWSRSIPAEQKIREIEEGIAHYETRIIEDPNQIIDEIRHLTANSNQLVTCLTPGGMQYSYNYFFDVKKKLLEKQKKGQHKGIRYISRIEKDNVDLESSFNSITIESFLSTTRIVALVSDICSMYLIPIVPGGQYSFNCCNFSSTNLFTGTSILTLIFLSIAACIANGIAPILSCLMKALAVGNIHSISLEAAFTISKYRSRTLAELGITSISAKSISDSISFILSIASTPFFHNSSNIEEKC